VLYPLSYEGGAAQHSESPPRAGGLPSPGVADGTVLVVDDDPVIVKLLTVNFELEGYTVISATDGQDGLARARAHHPDIVILDVMMPGLNGLDVARVLKSDPVSADLPIILLSAKARRLT
jgi:two-component system, OmpR family, phosphate regulon response regulator PhoB